MKRKAQQCDSRRDQRLARYVAGIAIFALLTCDNLPAQHHEDETIKNAAAVLNEAMATPGNRIPQQMLKDAYGVAIVPNVIKGGFVVGARYGRGLLFVRDPNGIWHAPVFITLTGGNIGWQAGVQASDIILVFKTLPSVKGILDGKLTLGADAGVAAGPIGRQAAAGTDGQMQAEIYTYSRSRGLFAGVSIDGSVVRVDQFATSDYYQAPAPGKPVIVPPAAQQLTEAIMNYTAKSAAAEGDVSLAGPGAAEHHATTDADVLRAQLVQLAPQLYELVDEQWKQYLALPASLFLDGPAPDVRELTPVLRNFDSVAHDPRFAELASRPEFQSVYGILQHYQQSLAVAPASQLQLPPPPPAN